MKAALLVVGVTLDGTGRLVAVAPLFACATPADDDAAYDRRVDGGSGVLRLRAGVRR